MVLFDCGCRGRSLVGLLLAVFGICEPDGAMTEWSALEQLARQAEQLRALHAGPGMLVLPNAWDAASAQVFEAAGFPAIATTSGGVAGSLGFEDHERAPLEEMAAAAGRIARAVRVPVTVDFEAGYGLEPQGIVERLLAIGAAGLNLEDSDHHGGQLLVDAEWQAERLAAVKAAGRAAGVDLFLNARVDVFVRRVGAAEEQLAEGLRRARLYRQAGADCVYPIMLADPAMISQLVEEVGAVNVNLRPDGPLSLPAVAALGVRRVTYASSLFRSSLAWLDGIARQIRAAGAAASGPGHGRPGGVR